MTFPLSPTVVAWLCAIALSLPFSPPALAAGDHSHAEVPATPGSQGAAPRFSASSQAFELVGVLKGRQITLYLDRFADNTPVSDAQIELDIAGQRSLAQPAGEGVYELTLSETPRVSELPFSATVTVGQQVDRLKGDLELPADDHADEAGHGHADDHAHGWAFYAGWAAAGVAAVALAALVVVVRRSKASRQLRAGGAA